MMMSPLSSISVIILLVGVLSTLSGAFGFKSAKTTSFPSLALSFSGRATAGTFPDRCQHYRCRDSLLQMSAGSRSSEWELTLKSPCKINLFLRILGRRPTGYHDLASLFQAVSLSDMMSFTKLPSGSTGDQLTCSDTTLQVDQSNLVIKAMNLMRSKTGIQQYFQVHLDKKVPMQAGLGGGSGNAATAMFAFNALTGFTASLEDLKLWSGDIGSDITFFFSSGTAYCTGRGEIVEPLPALPEAASTSVHIYKPKEGLSTALVFKNLNLQGCSPSRPEELLAHYQANGALVASREGFLINDLEPPAFFSEPKLARIKEAVEALPGMAYTGVMMSGSGTSIYGLVDKRTTTVSVTANPLGNKFDGLQFFPCDFINKKDDVREWY